MSLHDRHDPPQHPLRCAVLTVTDTRTLSNDESGTLIVERLTAAGHRVLERLLTKDEADGIRAQVQRWTESGAVDAVIVTGGTGMARRDVTVEAVRPLLSKEIDGFGELFRSLSYAEIGPAAMLSRALGGATNGVAVFVLPGSRAAVALAMTRLVIPELPHICRELSK